jgi:hypothetical protein
VLLALQTLDIHARKNCFLKGIQSSEKHVKTNNVVQIDGKIKQGREQSDM